MVDSACYLIQVVSRYLLYLVRLNKESLVGKCTLPPCVAFFGGSSGNYNSRVIFHTS